MISTSYKMIPDDYMYCKSAFPYENMDSLSLKEMDEKEKKIVEKENEQMEALAKKVVSYGLGGASVATAIFGSIYKISDTSGIAPSIILFNFIGSVVIGTALGASIGSNEPLKETINLRRMDRIDEKMRDIMKIISEDHCQQLSAQEIKELEKAHTYFSNRLFNYKADRSKTGGTHIGAQYITYSPNASY